jgi:hypothetical protein
VGDDVSQGGFSKTWWAKQQDMIQGLLALSGSRNENLELVANPLLSDVLLEGTRAQRTFDGLFVWTGRHG